MVRYSTTGDRWTATAGLGMKDTTAILTHVHSTGSLLRHGETQLAIPRSTWYTTISADCRTITPYVPPSLRKVETRQRRVSTDSRATAGPGTPQIWKSKTRTVAPDSPKIRPVSVNPPYTARRNSRNRHHLLLPRRVEPGSFFNFQNTEHLTAGYELHQESNKKTR